MYNIVLGIAQLVERWTVDVIADIHWSLVRFLFPRYHNFLSTLLCVHKIKTFALQRHTGHKY